ncbi:MAG TPA: hypothetical protein VGG19_14155 [Tepidisphaeraceae bacterium]
MPNKDIENQKWGASALKGYWLQGLAELRAAATPHAESPIAQPTNYAMPGMSTPGEIAESRREDAPSYEEESVLAGRLQPPSRDDKGRDDRGPDRE